jgi:uncharacterized membrane protein
MTVTAVVIVLGALLLVLVRVRALRFSAGLLCVVFGFLLASTAIAAGVGQFLRATGGWLWHSLLMV